MNKTILFKIQIYLNLFSSKIVHFKSVIITIDQFQSGKVIFFYLRKSKVFRRAIIIIITTRRSVEFIHFCVRLMYIESGKY